MSLVVGIQFPESGKIYYFDPGDFELEVGDSVVVETAHGEDTGEVILAPQDVEVTNVLSPLKKVLQLAERQPVCKPERDTEKEREAFRIGEEKIRERGLPMKLVDVEYAADGSRLIFYFAADGRIDFRELVRDLAAVFKTRIELRQIGVRDEAKKIGGLGPCGRPCCCNAFLEDFMPVSIKMAKEQNLSLSPTKISGLCGRLMCCLHYEHEHYHEMRKKLPHLGTYIETDAGPGEVVAADALTGNIKVKIALEDGSSEIYQAPLEEIRPYTGDKPPAPVAKPAPASEEDVRPARVPPNGGRTHGPRRQEAPVEEKAWRGEKGSPKTSKGSRMKDHRPRAGKPQGSAGRRKPYHPQSGKRSHPGSPSHHA